MAWIREADVDWPPPNDLYGELAEGKQPVDIPKLRCQDNRNLKDYGVDSLHRQTFGEGRFTLQASLTGGFAIDVEGYQTNQEIKRARRHAGNLPTRIS